MVSPHGAAAPPPTAPARRAVSAVSTVDTRALRREIIILGPDFARLRGHVLSGGPDEEAAILLAGVCRTAATVRLLVREVVPVPDRALLRKGPAGLAVNPDFLAALVKRCRLDGLAFVLVHSHPFSTNAVRFSCIDDFGEQALFPRVHQRTGGVPLGAIVFGHESVDARVWLAGEPAGQPADMVTIVDNQLVRLHATGLAETRQTSRRWVHAGRYARQELVLGAPSRRCLRDLRVVVVGAGGIGSLVYQQLVHLGVGCIDVVDHDVVEESNLSRLVGSTPADVGRPKVDVLDALRRRTAPELEGHAICGDVTDEAVVALLRDADVLFGCTDTLTSRLVLNRLAHQYFVPLIDLGIDVQVREDDRSRVRAIGGRVMLITPPGPCLGCLGVLDAAALAREVVGTEPVGYISGHDEPAPSVISFNGVVASLGVSEFLQLVTGYASRESPVYYRYDGVRGLVRTYARAPEQVCTVCAEVRGWGDGLVLPVRPVRPVKPVQPERADTARSP